MHKGFERKDTGISISDRLKINSETDKTLLNDLTINDGSEDPGSQLDTEFANTCQDNIKLGNTENNMTAKKNDNFTQQPSGNPPKGEELDAFTNNASKKKKVVKTPPKAQADQVLNPELNTANDI